MTCSQSSLDPSSRFKRTVIVIIENFQGHADTVQGRGQGLVMGPKDEDRGRG